jgi:uncharacterized protein YecE (DUF72 family)
MADIRIGISGWRYEPWRKVFYPPDLAQHRELEFAARAFRSIEINGSFYSLQTPASYQAWREATPEGFVFAVKGPRYVTHILRLKNVRKPLANFFALLPHDTEQALKLARSRDARMHGRSCLCIDASRPLRHAFEIRHESFVTSDFFAQLRRHDAALVVADTAGKWPFLEEVTSNFMYLRLHGDKELYASGYTEPALDRWARKIRAWASRRNDLDVFCYFDNDIKVRAPFDADRLMQKLAQRRADESFAFPSRRALRNIRPVTPLPPFRWRRPKRRAASQPAPVRSRRRRGQQDRT